MSIPFLFMVEYTVLPAQCQLNLDLRSLIYVVSLNIVVIFIPTLCLTILYIYMIIKLHRHFITFAEGENPSDNNKMRKNSKRKLNINFKESNDINPLDNTKRKQGLLTKDFLFNEPAFIRNTKNSHPIAIESLEEKSASMKNSLADLNGDSRTNQKSTLNALDTNLNKKCSKKEKPNGGSHRKTSNSNSTFNSKKMNKKKMNFTIFISLITLIFFCCQLPLRIFLTWSYFKSYYSFSMTEESEIETESELHIYIINMISYGTTLIYFLHCISNPIIYNILSIRFRKAFISLTKFKPQLNNSHKDKNRFNLRSDRHF